MPLDESTQQAVFEHVERKTRELFREDVAQYRAFLERLLNRVTWGVGIVLALILAGGAFLFGRSVNAAADSLLEKKEFEQRLTSQIDEKLVKAEAELDERAQSAIASYKQTIRDGVDRQVRVALDKAIDPALKEAISAKIAEVRQVGAQSLVEQGLIQPPVGSIVGWHKDFGGTPPMPPSGSWLPCDGQVVDDSQSPYNGLLLPDLNGTNEGNFGGKFLRGGDKSGIEQGATLHMAEFVHVERGAQVLAQLPDGSSRLLKGGIRRNYYINQDFDSAHSTEMSSVNYIPARPVNMSVVWIMRVK